MHGEQGGGAGSEPGVVGVRCLVLPLRLNHSAEFVNVCLC